MNSFNGCPHTQRHTNHRGTEKLGGRTNPQEKRGNVRERGLNVSNEEFQLTVVGQVVRLVLSGSGGRGEEEGGGR